MGRPSKFTQPVREKILEALTIGLPRDTAAALAGIGPRTFDRWLAQGREQAEDSSSGYRKFYDQVREAEVHIDGRAMGIIYREMDSQPQLAKWVLERRLSRYAPPQPTPPAPVQAPVLIQLNLSDGSPVALASTAIEVGLAENETAAESAAHPVTAGTDPPAA